MLRAFTQSKHFRWVRQNRTIAALVGRSAVGRFGMAPTRSFNGASAGAYDSLKGQDSFARQEWTKQTEVLDSDNLYIDGHPVMQRWETSYMNKLAKIATSNGGRVLEVGFGMAISATAVQSHPIDEHIIMEANGDVFQRLEKFAQEHPTVTPMGPALWQDSIAKIPDNSIDGILYDTYPLNKEEQHVHQFEFIKEARRVLKPGGILTYCNLTSLGVLKYEHDSWEKLFEHTQKPHLLAAGFLESEIKDIQVVPCSPTGDCEYYRHSTAMAPILVKEGGTARMYDTSSHTSRAPANARGFSSSCRSFVTKASTNKLFTPGRRTI